ncbi:heterokaryon incompatibility 6 OR allele [Fusarium phyllophilum]|uniref:Heterokaryon incompatibility 6 OR allele n=1 Tax=Fusarium phyllophilum TaxID=47803 RepID=A0A8H5NJP9_9HYPO|nr:heterokaryon incompatibility 6 OR allele [Fusarium phyllophilum]
MATISFVHSQLDHPSRQIRLIEVRPHEPVSTLELNLSTHYLTDDPYFYAVSYTWGSGELSEKLLVNGSLMMVTKNCYYALTQIYSHYYSSPKSNLENASSKHVYLWIDSICIAQDNLDEKGHQVGMMGDIYKRACRVLACVGPHGNDSEMLRVVLDDLKQNWPNIYLARKDIPEDGSFHWEHPIADGIKLFLQSDTMTWKPFDLWRRLDIRLRDAFLAFTHRNYWSRVWIIQEVAATNRTGGHLEVLCGSDIFSQSEVYVLFYIAGHTALQYQDFDTAEVELYLNHRISQTRPCFRFVMAPAEIRRIQAHKIFDFTEDRFKCSRPVDKIYGLLSLVKWRNDIPPEPAYHDSAALNLAAFLICQTSSLCMDDIARILKRLEISCDQKQMKEQVEKRDIRRIPVPGIETRDVSHHFNIGNRVVIKIRRNDEEKLEIPVVPSNESFSPRRWDDTGHTGEEFPKEDDKLSQYLYTDFKVTDYDVSLLGVPRYQVCGQLCSEAQDGDWLIETGYGSGLLVLRCTNNNKEYSVVGQGILFPAVNFPSNLPKHVETIEEELKEFRDLQSLSEAALMADLGPGWQGIPLTRTKRSATEIYLESELGESRRSLEISFQSNIILEANAMDMVVLAGQDIRKDGTYPVFGGDFARLWTRFSAVVRLAR